MSGFEPHARNKHPRFTLRPLVTATLTLALAAGSAQAAMSVYSVQHDFAFTTVNWGWVWGNPAYNLASSSWFTLAQADGRVDSHGGTDHFFAGNANLVHRSHASSGRAVADAMTQVSVQTTHFGLPMWWGGWGPSIDYTWGSTLAQGSAYAAPGSGGYAKATSAVNVAFGSFLPWGYTGSVYWQPTLMLSSSAGGASANEPRRRLSDPFSAVWLDPTSGATVKTDLLSIEGDWDALDTAAAIDWDAAEGTLTLQASKEANFSLVLDPAHVSNAGRLDVHFNAQGVGSLSGTGRFAAVDSSYDPAQSLFTIKLGAIGFDYNLPVDTYRLEASGGGVTSVPEPGAWALFLAGGLLLGWGRRRKT